MVLCRHSSRIVLLLVLVAFVRVSNVNAQPALPSELLDSLETVGEQLQTDGDAAASAIRQYFSETDQTLSAVFLEDVLSPIETQFVAVLLLLDAIQHAETNPELAMQALYLSSSLYRCEGQVCPVGTRYISTVSLINMSRVISQLAPVQSIESVLSRYLRIVGIENPPQETRPDEVVVLAGARTGLPASEEIPNPALLRTFLPIEGAFRFRLNPSSLEAVYFVESFNQITGMNVKIEVVTNHSSVMLLMWYSRELGGHLLAATPALLDRYDASETATPTSEP